MTFMELAKSCNVDTTAFNDDLHTILVVRNALSKTFFREVDVENAFMQLLYSYIDILKCEYNPEQLTYTIKVKKTSVKKMPNYRPEVSFYYNIISKMMFELLGRFKNRVIRNIMYHVYHDGPNAYIYAYAIYNKLMDPTRSSQLANLANIQCISDNIIQIIM